MTQEQLQKLNEICEDNGFVIKAHTETNSFVIEAKNEWEGVEFAELTTDFKPPKYKGSVCKIINYYGDGIIEVRLTNSQVFCAEKKYFKPSTEQAYKQQLIAEANERFGIIQDGERFRKPNDLISSISLTCNDEVEDEFDYNSNKDILSLHCFPFYEKGKWAERVEEIYPKVKELVDIIGDQKAYYNPFYGYLFSIRDEYKFSKKDLNSIAKFVSNTIKEKENEKD